MSDGFNFSNVNEKLGKLPIWGWGLIIGGGLAGIYYLKKGNTSVPDTTTAAADSSALTGTSGTPDTTGTVAPVAPAPDVTTTVPPVDVVPDYPDKDSSNGGGSNYGNSSSPTWTSGNGNSGTWLPTGTDTGTTPNTASGNVAQTLDAWRAAAIAKANQNSTLSTAYSTKAIDAYLAGQPLTATQAAQVKKALASLGTAPGTSLAVKVASATTAAATTPAATATSAPAKAATTTTAPALVYNNSTAQLGTAVQSFPGVGVVGPVNNLVTPGVPNSLKPKAV